MSHIDILNLFKEYKKLGKSDEEATLLIKSLDVNTLDFVTKTEFSYELEKFSNNWDKRIDTVDRRIDGLEYKIDKLTWMIYGVGTICVIPTLQSLGSLIFKQWFQG